MLAMRDVQDVASPVVAGGLARWFCQSLPPASLDPFADRGSLFQRGMRDRNKSGLGSLPLDLIRSWIVQVGVDLQDAFGRSALVTKGSTLAAAGYETW